MSDTNDATENSATVNSTGAATAQNNNADNSDAGNNKDPIKKLTLIILSICAFLFIWHLFADRITPYSDNARVRSYVVPIAPQVAGQLINVDADFSKRVKANDLLAKIDPRSYQMALDSAEANLEIAGQDINASTENVVAAEAKLAQQLAQLTYVNQQAVRYTALAAKGVISKAELDRTNAEVAKAEANVEAAEAEFEKAKESLGEEGQNNPKIRAAIAALGQARLNLAYTDIRAPGEGFVTNANLDVGQYAQPGKPIMTFISSKDNWIEAYMRENNLGNLQIGNKVDIALDIAPGKIIRGEVASLTLGVQWQTTASSAGQLPNPPKPGGWLRESQTFPVIIRFSDDNAKRLRLEGGQADVVIYTNNNVVLNTLAWLKIRIASVLSFIF